LAAFKSGGWIVALIGAAAMVGRLCGRRSRGRQLAAFPASRPRRGHLRRHRLFRDVPVGDFSSLNKAIVQGLCGAVAPELVDWVTSNIRRRLGYKDKQRTPAWKNLFKRKKKPKRRRRASAQKAAPAPAKKGAPKKGSAKPAAPKAPAKPIP
jgi:hypothetical protein